MGQDVQVVVLSAHGDSYAEQALLSGAKAFVPKGDIRQLLSTLSELAQQL
jgi:hypothetical protein